MVTTEKSPLYQTIFEQLFQRIREGRYGHNGKLESENDLCAEFHTSRQTIRMAIDMLIARGLVERAPGKGSFVIDPSETSADKRTANIVIVCPMHYDSSDAQVLCDAKVLNGVRSVFSERSTISVDTYPSADVKAADLQARYSPRQCDGLILLSPPIRYQKLFAKVAVPTIVIGHVIPEVQFSNISSNMFKMGYDSAMLLLEHGHSRFGYFSLNLENQGIKRFIDGVDNALLDQRRTWDSALRFGIQDMAQCQRAIDTLLAAGVTSFVLDGDNFAEGIYHDLRNRGLRVPEDISLIICEMHQALLERAPYYTGFVVDHFDLGVRGARMLQEFIDGSRDQHHPISLVINLALQPGQTLADLG